MKWTNKGGFPEAIVKAITNDSYSKGDADFSVTELIAPPQIKILQKRHSDKLVKDVSENIWALLGTSVHYILEQATGHPLQKQIIFLQSQLDDIKQVAEDLENGKLPVDVYAGDKMKDILSRQIPIDFTIETEHRYSVSIGGYIVSGAVDWYHSEDLIIEDYKFINVWKFIYGDWENYNKQLNVYKYIFAENGKPSKILRINAIFRDWKMRETGAPGYPDFPVKQIDVEQWDSLDTLQYLLDRIKLHIAADKCKSDQGLADKFPCTDKERWANKSFAIKKKGGKNASWKFETIGEAHEKFKNINAIEYEIEDRSSYRRCEDFCDVAQFCHQYKQPQVKLEASEVVIDPSSVKLDDSPKDTSNDAGKIIKEKESTDDLIARIKKRTDKAVANIGEKHGYDIPAQAIVDIVVDKTKELIIKSEKKEDPKPKISNNTNLGDLLGDLGL